MIHDLILETRFHREWLVKELLIEILFLLRDEHTRETSLIKLRSTCSSNHLEKIGQGEVNVPADLRIEEFGALDHDQASWEVNSPGKGARRDEDLDLLLDEEVLHNLAVLLLETCMMHSHAEVQSVSQVLILN